MANRHLQFLKSNTVSETKTEAINKLKNIFNNPARVMKDGEGAIERYFEYFIYDNTKGRFVKETYNSTYSYAIAETIPEPFVPKTIYTSKTLVISNGRVYQSPTKEPKAYDTIEGWSVYNEFSLETRYKTVRSLLGIATLYNYDTDNTDPKIAMTVIDNEDAIQELSDKLSNLDFNDTPESAKVITKIVRENGNVTITRAKLTNSDSTISLTQPVPSGTFDGSQDIVIDLKISTNDKVLSKDAAAAGNGLRANVTLHKITSNEIGTGSGQYNLPTNVKEAYVLRGNGTTQAYDLGDRIDIYKDSSLHNVYIGHVDDRLSHADGQGESLDAQITSGTGNEALCFIYLLADGKYKLAAFDIESILIESEFKDGLNVDAINHTASVKIDNVSTEFGSETGTNKSIKVKVSDDSNNIIEIKTGTNPGLYSDSSKVKITSPYTAPTYNTDGSSIDTTIDANAVAAGNTVTEAVQKVDTKLAAVTNAVIDAEAVITNTFAKTKAAMGASGADDSSIPGINNKFEYVADPNANYIKDANSLFKADEILDSVIKSNTDAIDANTQKIITLQKSDRYYGISNENGSFAAKTVNGDNLAGFTYTNGERIVVTFTNANTASNATLNVNGLGAKPIYYNGAPVAAGVIETGSTHLFVYEGSGGGKFILTGDMSDSSVEYIREINQGNGISITENTTDAAIGSGATFSATWLNGITQTTGTAISTIYKITTQGSYYGQTYKWDGNSYVRYGIVKTISTRLSSKQIASSGAAAASNQPDNMLAYDSTGALSILDTWDCGTYDYI